MKYLPLIFSILLLHTACIDEVDLKTNPEAPLVVVDAVFTDVLEEQIIRLYQSQSVDIQTPQAIRGAEVYVEDESGTRIIFPEQEDGSYRVETQAIIGKQYGLYAKLPDGTIITSALQPVPQSFPIDDIYLVDTMVMVLDESGNRQRINSIDFYASGNSASVSEDLYMRFRYETVYQVSEVICSPLAPPPKSCYIYNDQPPNSINLLTISQTENPVAYNTFVYRRKISTNLGELFALDLSLYSYNRSAYQYWEEAKTIFDQSGNITDGVPARLRGNIIADNGQEILGLFAVVGKTRKVKLVVNADFPSVALPYCGLPGLQPYPLPSECCGCQELKGATLNKPDYWP